MRITHPAGHRTSSLATASSSNTINTFASVNYFHLRSSKGSSCICPEGWSQIMIRTIRLLVYGMVFFVCGQALADTLICRDGRELSGEVTQTATGYIIKTKVAEF